MKRMRRLILTIWLVTVFCAGAQSAVAQGEPEAGTEEVIDSVSKALEGAAAGVALAEQLS